MYTMSLSVADDNVTALTAANPARKTNQFALRIHATNFRDQLSREQCVSLTNRLNCAANIQIDELKHDTRRDLEPNLKKYVIIISEIKRMTLIIHTRVIEVLLQS